MITQSTDLELVRGLVHGRWKAQTLAVTLRLGLPDLVGDEPRAAGDLADALGVSPDGLGRLLRLLAAMGLLDHAGGERYAATEASRMLRRDHPRSLRAEALHVLAPWAGIAWDHLESSVRHGAPGFERTTGTTLFAHLAAHPDESAAFQDFQAIQVRRNIEALSANHAFPSSGTVVDVGGGDGTMLRQVLARQPGLRGVLQDRPDAIARARAAAAGSPVESRLTLVEGDFFDSAPPAADVYLLSHVLHDWADADAVRILRAVGGAMRADSELVLMENVPNGRPGLVLAYLDLLMLTSTGGRERTLDEHRALLAAAGLRLASHRVAEPRTALSILTAHRG